MAELFGTVGTSEFDDLFADVNPPARTKNVTIVNGAGSLKRGTVLGEITVSGKFTTVNSKNTDGSQTGNCILADDVDATSADAVGTVFLSGSFNASKLIVGGIDTIDKHEAALRDLNIYVVHSI